MSRSKKPRLKKQYVDLFDYTLVGIEMGAAVGIGVLIGWWLDTHGFDGRTSPWLTLLFMGLGIVAAGRVFWRTAKQLRERSREGYEKKEE